MKFGRRNPMGDPFTYDTWAGVYELVKLDLGHPEVKRHLFEAVVGFLRELAAYCRSQHPEFWLLGEVVHGDYTRWANPGTLDATTNYQAYKGLWSSHNDLNYFEIAHSLDRQFGPRGVYAGLPLYSFADNHDVDRIASKLKRKAHLFPLHILLFTMPGVPSIYYGSEFATAGLRTATSDRVLRPAIASPEAAGGLDHPLAAAIARLARLRGALRPLRYGKLRLLHVAREQLAFVREHAGESVVVVLNAADAPVAVRVAVPFCREGVLVVALDPQARFVVRNGHVTVTPVHSNWGRVLVPASRMQLTA